MIKKRKKYVGKLQEGSYIRAPPQQDHSLIESTTMKRVRDLPIATEPASSSSSSSSSSSEEHSSDEEEEYLNLTTVPIDFTHKFIHFTYEWIETTHDEDVGNRSILIDITDTTPADRKTLLLLLNRELIAKCCALIVADGDDGVEIQRELLRKERRLIESFKWCQIPGENTTWDDSKAVQIISFVTVSGAY